MLQEHALNARIPVGFITMEVCETLPMARDWCGHMCYTTRIHLEIGTIRLNSAAGLNSLAFDCAAEMVVDNVDEGPSLLCLQSHCKMHIDSLQGPGSF